MFDPEQRSRAFNFALKAQSIFGIVMGITILWSLYNLLFTDHSHIFISKILLTMICIGFATITPLIDFNESHATNPLWTCLLYTSPSPRDRTRSRMPSSA